MRVLLDCGGLDEGEYEIAFSRIGSLGGKLETRSFYARIDDDGTPELSEDGDWSRFGPEFSDEFRKEEFYRRFTRGIDSVPSDSIVLDVRKVLDTP